MTVRIAGGGYEAVFRPDVGMLGTSLTYRGAELLSLHGGLEAYQAGHTTGLPLLHPWANRLSRLRYRAAGVDVDLEGVPLHVGDDGLPRHGTMGAQPGWEVVSDEGSRVVARFDYSQPDLLAAFPYPHELVVTASVGDEGFTVELAARPTDSRPLPVAFGWHPYFRVPGERSAWVLGMPETRHLELDSRGIPTGGEKPRPASREPLGDQAFDDLFALGDDRRFTLEGDGGAIEVRFDAGYPYAQIFAPAGKAFVAIEPMTAPTDALVTGACPVVAPGDRFAATFTVSAAE